MIFIIVLKKVKIEEQKMETCKSKGRDLNFKLCYKCYGENTQINKFHQL